MKKTNRPTKPRRTVTTKSLRKAGHSRASPGAGMRSLDGTCMFCRKAPPHYVSYPVCEPCWLSICKPDRNGISKSRRGFQKYVSRNLSEARRGLQKSQP